MMTIIHQTVFFIYVTLVHLLVAKNIFQPDPVMVAPLGGTATITCIFPTKVVSVDWYKQTLGQKPLLVVSSFYYISEVLPSENFSKDFTDTKRLNVSMGVNSCNLTIANIQQDDSGTYYCASTVSGRLEFADGTLLLLEGPRSKILAIVQQPASKSIKSGDSVTLNCTVHTGAKAGDHRVYWFRGLEDSHPGIIYTHANQSKENSGTGSMNGCNYYLQKKNVSLYDAGTYYCAVASCGEILFGNGTKLDIEGPSVSTIPGDPSSPLSIVLFGLTIALILSVMANIVLCMQMKWIRCEHVSGISSQQMQNGYALTSVTNELAIDGDDNLNYAALRVTNKRSNKPNRQRTEEQDETIYSGVSCQNRK